MKRLMYLATILMLLPSCLPVNGLDTLSPEDRGLLFERILDSTVVLGFMLDGSVRPNCAGAIVEQVILTANHCISLHPTNTFVALRRGETFDWIEARVISTIPEQDIAVLQIARALPEGLRVARHAPGYGDSVAVVGHPYLLYWTYEVGIVTFPMRTSGGMTGEQIWMQHDMDTDPGDSGGPILNARGELVSIVSFGIGRQEGGVHLSQIVRVLETVGLEPR